MDIEQARRCLRILTAAFPTYPVGDDTVELYLARLLPWDFEVAFYVVQRWAANEVKFPVLRQLHDALRAETNRRAPPALPVDPEASGRELPPEENAEKLAQLRAVLPTLVKRAP